jgi:3-oxoacyl-[acyl-carrier protein] reductase
MDLLGLSGKIALVTGARQGIGREVAVSLARQGAAIAAADIAISEEDEVCREAAAQGGDVLPICCDVSEEAAVAAAFQLVMERFGAVDVLVNNAGITRDAMSRKMSADQFRAVLDVNLTGSFLCARQAMDLMRGRGGSIVNFSSMAGLLGNMGQANYTAAKAGIIGLTKTLALEGARDGIRVNAVAPGFIDTPMTQAMPEAQRLAAIARIPLGCGGAAADVANAVLFLAGDMSSFITGHVLHVNGGRFM